MRSIAVLLLALTTCGAGIACEGDDRGEPPAPSTTTTTLPPRVPSAEELGASTLVLTDLPSGWTEQPPRSNDTVPDERAGICSGPNLYAQALRHGATAFADPAFSADPQFGPFASQTLVAFPDAPAARRFMAALDRSSDCDEFELSLPGTPAGAERITVERAPLGDLGDELVGRRLASDGGGARRYVQDNVYVRRDNVVIALALQASTVPEGTPPDQQLLRALVERTLDRVDPLVAEVPPTTTSTTPGVTPRPPPSAPESARPLRSRAGAL